MKTTLTPQESATLIAKGISADKASMFAWQKVRDGKGNPLSEKEKNREYNHGITPKKGMMIYGLERIEYTPIFTLADLLELLPKELMIDGVTYYLNMLCMGTWVANYINAVGDDYVTGILHSTTELIDALYNLLLWCLDNNLIKPTE